MRLRTLFPYFVLLGGVMAAASSSIMIRLAQGIGLPSTTIAAGRLCLAALILLPLALMLARKELQTLGRRDISLGLIAGVFLAIHFITWISSLEYTSVASSVAFVTTNPLWVALASVVVFRERLSPLAILGVLLTVGGSVLIGFSDSSDSTVPNALLGDGLALIGAFTVSIYFLIGRELRRKLSTLPYIWLVYSSAAVILLIIAWIAPPATPPAPDEQTRATIEAMYQALPGLAVPLLGFPLLAGVLLLGLALGPQLLGHTAFNWSLRYLSATFVAVTILGEPIGSALLALVLFGETFRSLQLIGFAVLLIGIAVAAWAERGAPKPNISQAADIKGQELNAEY